MKTGFILIATVSFFVTTAWADAGLSLRGRLLKPDGAPVAATNVQFKVQVRTPVPSSCLLFEEIHTKDLSASAGLFVITLNDGTATTPNVEPYTLEKTFSALGSVVFPAGKCVTGSTAVDLTETTARQIVVAFNDGSFSGWEPLPAITENFAGQALASVSSASVGGFKAGELFRVVDGGLPQPLGAWSSSSYTKLTALVADTTIAGGSASIGGNAAGFTGTLSGDVTGSQTATFVGALRGKPISSTAPNSGEVLTWDGIEWKGMASIALPAAPVGKYLKSSGGAVWSGQDILIGDIKSSFGGPAFGSSSCGADQALHWISAMDRFECQNIGFLDASVLTTGVLNPSRFPASFTNAMWSAGSGNVYRTSGNVGIGTSTPASPLDVAGDARIQGSLQLDGSLSIRAPDGTGAQSALATYGGPKSSFVFQKANGSSFAPTPVSFGDNLGEISWRAYDGSAFRPGAWIFASAAENWSAGTSGAKIRFAVTPNGTALPQVKMTLTDSGFLGVGTDNPTEALEVAGKGLFSGEVTAVGFTYSSDLRFKRDVTPLSRSLDKLLSLQGVSYLWRRDEFPEKKFNDRRQIGLIAQDVEKEFPELVSTDGSGYRSVNYAALVSPIIEAIRELYHKYASQEERLLEQDRRIEALEQSLSELKRRVACEKDGASGDCR